MRGRRELDGEHGRDARLQARLLLLRHIVHNGARGHPALHEQAERGRVARQLPLRATQLWRQPGAVLGVQAQSDLHDTAGVHEHPVQSHRRLQSGRAVPAPKRVPQSQLVQAQQTGLAVWNIRVSPALRTTCHLQLCLNHLLKLYITKFIFQTVFIRFE